MRWPIAIVCGVVLAACGASTTKPSTSASLGPDGWKKMCSHAKERRAKCGASAGEMQAPEDQATCESTRACFAELLTDEALDALADCMGRLDCELCGLGRGKVSPKSEASIAKLVSQCKKTSGKCANLVLDCDGFAKEGEARALRPDLVDRLAQCFDTPSCDALQNCVSERLGPPVVKLASCMTGGVMGALAPPEPPPLDLPEAPHPRLPAANGKGMVLLEGSTDKNVVTVFYLFPHDCADCVKALARLEALRAASKKRLEVIAIAEGGTPKAVNALASKAHVTFPVAIDETKELPALMGLSPPVGLPLLVIPSPTGRSITSQATIPMIETKIDAALRAVR